MLTHHLHFFESSDHLLIFLIITITLIQFPTPLRADDSEYLQCGGTPLNCAGIQGLGYPFWGSNRPNYCGHPAFELNCSGDVPQITTMSMNYRVLEINSVSRNLTVARTDYWKTLCPPQLANTAINVSIFSYASDSMNLKLHYGCPILYTFLTVGQIAVNPPFNCSINDTIFVNYYVTDALAATLGDSLGTCSYIIEVPVLVTANQALQRSATQQTLVESIDDGFTLLWDANNSMCDACQGSGGQCGSIPTTTEFACHCASGTFPYQCGSTTSGSKRDLLVNIAIGVSAGVAGIVVIIIVVIYSLKRQHLSSKPWSYGRKTKDEKNVEAFIRNSGSLAPKRYSYSYVKKVTNSFADKVGQGGFGAVYKGTIPDGRLVAIKVLSESKGNGEEFINEVASISRTSHVNVVTLLGFCYERTKRALIYEFMSNGSLDKFIYNRESSGINCHLEWKTIYQIAVGVARGLEYLHRGCNTRILHFDIKPQNILLDGDFCPKISDFGLAKLCKIKESIVSMQGMRGTARYIAPEVFSRNFGGVSHKSDVYSYGMLVLEMVGGRKNFDSGVSHTSEIYFPHWIYKKLELGENVSTYERIIEEAEEEAAKKMMMVSLWCIQTNPKDRPSMGKVIEMLEGTLESLQFPPKPFLDSPTRSSQHSSVTL